MNLTEAGRDCPVNWCGANVWHILASRSKLVARASRCRTPLQALARASQAERSSRSPASASRCSCPSSERKVACRARRQARLPDMRLRRTPQQLVDPLDARVGTSIAFTLAMSARATSSSAGVGRMAPIVAAAPWSEPGHDFVAQFRVRTLHTNNQVNPGQRASKRF